MYSIKNYGKELRCLNIWSKYSIPHNTKFNIISLHNMLNLVFVENMASVAQLDARPTGDQEVGGLTPAEVGNILS